MIKLIEVRHRERIKLSVPALHHAVDSFLDLACPVIVSFDRRICDHGWHVFEKDRHYIRVGLRYIEHLDVTCQKHEVINTLLHELAHAQQCEKYGLEMYESEFMQAVPGVKHERISYDYCVAKRVPDPSLILITIRPWHYMTSTHQKFRVHIELDLAEEEFFVDVINMSARKGFIDLELLKSKLKDVFEFMLAEGMDELTEQVEKEQLQ